MYLYKIFLKPTVSISGINLSHLQARYYMASPKEKSAPAPRYHPGAEEVQKVKDNYLNMALDVKRQKYLCGHNYFTLADVPTWPEYFVKNEVDPIPDEKMFEPNDKINSKVSIWCGDITALEIDSIVNAANNEMLGGSGVDGAIHGAAGAELYDECYLANGCPDGQAKVTGGYRLPAKYVIHTVGPRGENPQLLSDTYSNSLERMIENNFKAIAFPCISTGIYGYPNANAAHVALCVVRGFLEKHADKVDRVIFVLFLDEDKKIYEQLMQQYFPLP